MVDSSQHDHVRIKESLVRHAAIKALREIASFEKDHPHADLNAVRLSQRATIALNEIALIAE